MTAIRTAAGAWDRFWFAPQETSSLALFRIAFGIVAFCWGLALFPGLDVWFTSTGIEPEPVDVTWGLLGHLRSDAAVHLAYVALLGSALAVIVGYRTRLASVVLFVTVFSFLERTHSIFNSGDGLVRLLAFFLIFMPAGGALSVDRWRSCREQFWQFPKRAPWALRLVQIQLSVLYLSTVHHKLVGGTWTDGTALSYVWRIDDIVRLPVPDAVVHSVVLSSLVTSLTVVIELLIGVLVWVPSTRPLVLGLGVALHVGIDVSLRIGFFSAAIIAAYLAFLSPDTATDLILRARERIRRRARRSGPRRTTEPAQRPISGSARFGQTRATSKS